MELSDKITFTVAGIAAVGGVLMASGLYLIILFFSGGGWNGQYWNLGWTVLIPGSVFWIIAAILYWHYGSGLHTGRSGASS